MNEIPQPPPGSSPRKGRSPFTAPDDTEPFEVLADFLSAGGVADASETANRLLAEFASLARVISAAPGRIRSVNAEAAQLVTASRLLMKAAMEEQLADGPLISDREDLLLYLRFIDGYSSTERLTAFYLDSGLRLLRVEVISEGSVTETPGDAARIVRRGFEVGASHFILVHNHPSGDPTPSAADIAFTRKLGDAARTLGLELVDHLIVARDSVCSVGRF